MRTSAGGIGLHPDLEALLRRGDPQVDQFIEALQITRSDVRQRKDQWNAADSLTGLQVLDHGVRLAETVQTLIPERAQARTGQRLDARPTQEEIAALTEQWSALGERWSEPDEKPGD